MSSFESDKTVQEQVDKYREHLVEQYVSAKCGYYQSVLKEIVKQNPLLNTGYLSTMEDTYIVHVNGIDRQINIEVCTNVTTGEVINRVYMSGASPETPIGSIKMDDIILGHWIRFNKAVTELTNYNRGIQGALCC